MLRRILIVSTVIPALVAGMMVVARAQTDQTEQQIPAVEVHPVGTTRSDPNGGQWFIVNLEFDETKQLQARLYNPADVPQTVKLYLADMTFDAQGIPEVTNVASDVGTWGAFEHPSVTIEPKQQLVETFTLTAPHGVDPGDHVGAVVVEQAPQGSGNIRSVKRLAVRLYATLPGDAGKDFEIEKVTVSKDSFFFPREVTVTVELRNTGHVRLEPAVTVDGAPTKGPALLMSSAVERYVVTRPVRFWGGPVRLNVNAQTRSLGLPGPSRDLRVTSFVIPWHLFALLVLLAGLVLLVRWVLSKRGGRYREVQADLRRIERMLSQQHRDTPLSGDAAAPLDANAAVREAIKRARRAGDEATVMRLEQKLHDDRTQSSYPVA